jgi:hypothetical protein
MGLQVIPAFEFAIAPFRFVLDVWGLPSTRSLVWVFPHSGEEMCIERLRLGRGEYGFLHPPEFRVAGSQRYQGCLSG